MQQIDLGMHDLTITADRLSVRPNAQLRRNHYAGLLICGLLSVLLLTIGLHGSPGSMLFGLILVAFCAYYYGKALPPLVFDRGNGRVHRGFTTFCSVDEIRSAFVEHRVRTSHDSNGSPQEHHSIRLKLVLMSGNQIDLGSALELGQLAAEELQSRISDFLRLPDPHAGA
jgi:hypothetical protein